MRTGWLIPFAAQLGLVGGACGPSVPVVDTYRRVGVSAPADGPALHGPQPTRGTISLEGAATGARVVDSGKTGAESAPGNAIPRWSFGGRLAFAANDDVELGLGVDTAAASASTPLATDAPMDRLGSRHFLRYGGLIRGRLAGDRKLEIGGMFEIWNDSIPYYERVTRHYQDGTVDELASGVHSTNYLQLRGGLYGGGMLSKAVSGVAGMLIQNYPLISNTEVVRSCPNAGSTTGCSPTARPKVPETVVLATPFAWLSVGGDTVIVTLYCFANPFEAGALGRPAPFGGGLALGLRFDTTASQGQTEARPPAEPEPSGDEWTVWPRDAQ
jgi:hypothetical protein